MTDRLQFPISAATAHYIKLGPGGRFAQDCFEGGYLGLSFKDIPHELCIAGAWDEVATQFRALGKSAQVASNHTRELRAFYTSPADALWITIENGRLWWTFADANVQWFAEDHDGLPRRRRSLEGWRSTDIQDRPLSIQDLSSRLTQIARYHGSICDVQARDYLLRRLNGIDDPLAVEAAALKTDLISVVEQMISALHWKDFELLVDLIFAASGWRRISAMGGSEADFDLIIEQAATGERAFVQVKSRADVAVLEDYVARFRARGDCSRMFFVCHTPTRALAHAPRYHDVQLWFSRKLAELATQCGLAEWITLRVK